MFFMLNNNTSKLKIVTITDGTKKKRNSYNVLFVDEGAEKKKNGKSFVIYI